MKLYSLLLASVGAFALSNCDGGSNDPPTAYPIKKVLTNWEGQELDVTIVGRSGSEVIFTKAGSDQRHSYPIAKLSEDDQKYAYKLPKKEFRVDSPWIKSKKDELRRIKTRIAEAEADIEATPAAKMRVRSKRDELKKLKAEKKALEKSIEADQKAGK